MSEHPDGIASQTITALVDRWVRDTPDQVALECREEVLTYRGLDRAARVVADRLRTAGISPGQVVAVAAERTAATVAAILGVLRSGCCYLPLELNRPAAYPARVLRAGAPALLLATPAAGSDFTGLPRLVLDAKVIDADVVDAAPPGQPVSTAVVTDGAAYLMPTSGTSTAGKLVEVTHRNVAYNVGALRAAVGGISVTDAYLHFASFAFSSSVRQLFLPLTSGARVVLAAGAERLDPRATLDRIRLARVTVLDVIPSLLAVLLEAAGEAANLGPELRLVLTASERLPGSLVTSWFTGGPPRARLVNMYGQTETTGIVCVQPVAPEHAAHATVPIGRPIPGTTVRLVGPDDTPVGPGAAGEIVLAGAGVARGYRGDPDRSAAAFDTVRGEYRSGDLALRTDDDTLRYLGRLDRRIKVRGRVVDLAAVERLLESHPAVVEAVVADAGEDASEPQLAAAVRCRDGVLTAEVGRRVRYFPDDLPVLDMNPAETDFMYDEIFVRQVYLRHGMTLPADAVVIDAGANIGLFSMFVAATRPRSRVVAVEPVLPIAEVLVTNLRVNGLANVSVRMVGLGAQRGPAEITFYPHSPGMSSMHADRSEEASVLRTLIANEVGRGELDRAADLVGFTTDLVEARLIGQRLPCTLVRLSDLLADEGIDRVDLLKIDVQKSELEVLDGVADGDWEKIDQIVAEVHDIDGRLDAMADLLSRLGYTVIAEQDPMFLGSGVSYLHARRADGCRPANTDELTDVGAGTRTRGPGIECLDPGEMLAFLAERLEPHAVPATVHALAELPRTVSGKPDRPAIAAHLRHLVRRDADPDHASDPYIAEIGGVWAEVLRRNVTARDDFFDLGGNSLSVARMVTRLRTRYSAELPIRLVYEVSRLDEYAARVRDLLTDPRTSR